MKEADEVRTRGTGNRALGSGRAGISGSGDVVPDVPVPVPYSHAPPSAANQLQPRHQQLYQPQQWSLEALPMTPDHVCRGRRRLQLTRPPLPKLELRMMLRQAAKL